MNQAPPDYESRALPLYCPACLISSDEHAIQETKLSIPVSLKYVFIFVNQQENQDREERQQKKKLQRGQEQREARIEMLQQGKKPRYPTKCKCRIITMHHSVL